MNLLDSLIHHRVDARHLGLAAIRDVAAHFGKTVRLIFGDVGDILGVPGDFDGAGGDGGDFRSISLAIFRTVSISGSTFSVTPATRS